MTTRWIITFASGSKNLCTMSTMFKEVIKVFYITVKTKRNLGGRRSLKGLLKKEKQKQSLRRWKKVKIASLSTCTKKHQRAKLALIRLYWKQLSKVCSLYQMSNLMFGSMGIKMFHVPFIIQKRIICHTPDVFLLR